MQRLHFPDDGFAHAGGGDDGGAFRLQIGGAPALGSRYRSEAQSHGVNFSTELVVTLFEPPRRFGFGGADATGEFSHEFSLTPSGDGTLVKRRITFQTTFSQWLAHLLVLYPVRMPSARRTLNRLKEKLENTG